MANDDLGATAVASDDEGTEGAVAEKKKSKRGGRPRHHGDETLDEWLSIKIARSELDEIDALVPSWSGSTRSHVARALVRIGLAAAKKNPKTIGDAMYLGRG